MKKRILCFGDSNTWGTIPGESARYADDVRWTGVLQNVLGDGYTVIEEGNGGRTTVHDDPVERRLSGLTYFTPCCESHSPLDLIIIMLGTNDLKIRFGEGPETIAMGFGRYQEALTIVSMDGGQPKVLLVSPILVDASYQDVPVFRDMFGSQAVERSQGLASAYQKVAEVNGWEFLNAADYVKASEKDGIHMDAEQHKIFGTVLAQKVKEILEMLV